MGCGMPRALRAEEETLADLLQRTGLSRPAARCLTCLARGGDWTSLGLAEAAGLSQPGVSQGMRELLADDLAQRGFRHAGGKGRPAHVYSLGEPATTVLTRVEQNRRAWVQAELATLDELRDAIKRVGG